MKRVSTIRRRPGKKRPLQWMRILLIGALLVAGISLIMARGASAHSSVSVSPVTAVVSQVNPKTPTPTTKKSPTAKPKAAPKGPAATAKPKAAPKAKPTSKPKAA